MRSKAKYGLFTAILGIFFAISIIPSISALEENGVIEMPYTENIPTIDGKWTSPDEWDDAYLHTDTNDDGTFYVLTKHDRDYIYLMFDKVDLLNLNYDLKVTTDIEKKIFVNDFTKICFDTENDGGYEIKNDDFCFIAHATGEQDKLKSGTTYKKGDNILKLPSGLQSKVKFSSENDPYESGRDHIIYEIRVPISFLHKNDVYGFKYDMMNHNNEKFAMHSWPTDAEVGEPATWGALVDPENKVTAPPVPFMSISTKEIDFGNVAVSEESRRGVTISNQGTAPLHINSISSSGNFAVRGIDTPTQVEPNESVTFDVNFSPLSLGSKTGSITVKTNDLTTKTIVIKTSGKGTEKGVIAGGGCLIATATYGSELAPQVQQLRELRDNTLLLTESGTSFMTGFNEFYYSFSPVIADLERESPVFKELVKITITPMLSSLSILNYVDIDSESEMLGYGMGIIILNVGMYFGLPIFGIIGLNKIIFYE